VQGISDLITTTGMINVDFADVKAIMSVRGMAMMGIGISSGDNRAAEAATAAISSPLLEDIDISGAKGVLVNICGSASMTMDEYEIVSRIIHEKVHEDANIIIGLLVDEELGDNLKVTAIATGFGDRFDKEKERVEREKVTKLQGVTSRTDFDRPTFERNREEGQRRPTMSRQPSFLVEDEDQYDIPTFLRKSVD
jgi:cell division protein FtsZ